MSKCQSQISLERKLFVCMSYLFIILESEVRSVTFSFFRVSNIHHSSHKFIISCQWFLKQWISVLQYCVHGSVSAKVLLVC